MDDAFQAHLIMKWSWEETGKKTFFPLVRLVALLRAKLRKMWVARINWDPGLGKG